MEEVEDNVMDANLELQPFVGLDVNMDDISFRLRVREMLRARQAGASFCDDEWHQNPTEPPALPSHVLTGIRNSNLVASAFCASTEDHPDQKAEMTVQNDRNFWSSTGSPHDIGEEFILYKLQDPLSVVRAVVVQVYRATFQGGGPIYPAKQVLIDVGHSPSTMRTVAGPFTMACTDAEQTFLIPPTHQAAATGSYVGVRFLGKHQKQLFDDQYYLSMQHIRVLGAACATADIIALRSLISIPNPPHCILPPACIPQPLTAALDQIIGSNHTDSTGNVDEYTVKIELPGWAQKDFMHFVEQLASSAGPHAPSHQLLPSLCLHPRSLPAGNPNGNRSCTGDWLHDMKVASNWPSPQLTMPHDPHAGTQNLSHRSMHGGGMHAVVDDAQYTVLDQADTTADTDVAPDAVDTMRVLARESVSAAQEPAQLRPATDDNSMHQGITARHTGTITGMPVDSVADTGAAPSFVNLYDGHEREGGLGGDPDSRATDSWVQGVQHIRGMAELDAPATVPGSLFVASSPVPPAAHASAYGTLPPITPLGNTGTGAAGREWLPPWPCMHAYEACDGPVHASVCEDGGLRCVVWERRGRQSLEQRQEAVEESQMHTTGSMHASTSSRSPGVGGVQGRGCSGVAHACAQKDASLGSAWPRASLKTAPAALMWCRDPSSSAVGGVRLQGTRKRPACGSAGFSAASHQAPRRERWPDVVGARRPCTRGDITRMLFGPVQSERFTVPMD